MVERLKQAIEKARLAREGKVDLPPTPGVMQAMSPTQRSAMLDEKWRALPLVASDHLRRERNRIVSLDRQHPTSISFDRLRTRILKLCRDNGWSTVAVTSPTRACGKTMVTTNLAFSIARNPVMRTLLIELDLRAPSMRRLLDFEPSASIDALLRGEVAPEAAAFRLTDNLAACLGNGRVPNSSELLQMPDSLARLVALRDMLKPDITLIDLPPMFGCDDALAFLPNVDATLMIAAAGRTTAEDLNECERLIGSSTVLLGIVLNKADMSEVDNYGTGYGTADVSG